MITHPCAHCAKAPGEQEHLHDWCAAMFGERPALATLAAHSVRLTATLTEAVIAGERDEAIDAMAQTVVVLYRVSSAYNVDLWQQVTAAIAELLAHPDSMGPL